MVGPPSPARLAPSTPRNRPSQPWEGARELDKIAFATLWTTGPDPARDGVFRLQALRLDADAGTFEVLESPARPFPSESPEEARATRRMAREYGTNAADLLGAPPAPDAFRALEEFLEGRVVVTVDAVAFRTWALALGHEPGRLELVDLPTLAALLAPGRLAAEGDGLARVLLGAELTGPVGPEDLRAALARLVGRILSAPVTTLAVLAHALVELVEGYRDFAPERARELVFVARLLEHPSRWRARGDGLYPEHAALTDGQLSDAVRAYESLGDAFDAARPPWTARDEREPPSLPPFTETPRPLDAADRRSIDEVFQEHLPRTTSSYRAGQHALAARIAESFGTRELALLHAPTGTGKTLAYLVPTMLWAYRHGVRVGIATFTRALQEQAFERDVPMAEACLARIGVRGVRTALLKGRTNYLCWRALSNHRPVAGGNAAELQAWLSLGLFGLLDADGDLDRFSLRAPLATLDEASWQSDVKRLVRLVRAETGCCTIAFDRDTCAAEAARRRAERSHVVITNHAFALARRDYFRHLVFDECEHLHDVALNAFSHRTTVNELRDLLARTGAELEALEPRLLHGSHGEVAVADAKRAGNRARWALDGLADALVGFKDWRSARTSARQDGDAYSLFREYAESDESHELLRTHRALVNGLCELQAALNRFSEHLDELPRALVARRRRGLELLRAEVDDALAAALAWIPRAENGAPRFRRETFNDLETTPRGDDVLAARVLLPHEHLGRHYYPDLSGAVFLSATTFLKGGFEAQATYLGLARAAEPAEDEHREPCLLSTFRAPEAFEYSRVLVGVPRDAPAIRDKGAFLDYVARFVSFLAERTRGRMLVLFTNAEDLTGVGRRLEDFFRTRHLSFWYQRMEGSSKEELGERFRAQTDSVLFGLDTFWYGTDFPGNTLEYLVLVRLPYGVPDHYHEAQCAALGAAEQRRQIYMPRALAKFRQGFGRLMRRETDKGCVFVLDRRILDPRHRAFLRELPVQSPFDEDAGEGGATLVRGDTDRCIDAALAHMEMKADVERRSLDRSFVGWRPEVQA